MSITNFESTKARSVKAQRKDVIEALNAAAKACGLCHGTGWAVSPRGVPGDMGTATLCVCQRKAKMACGLSPDDFNWNRE